MPPFSLGMRKTGGGFSAPKLCAGRPYFARWTQFYGAALRDGFAAVSLFAAQIHCCRVFRRRVAQLRRFRRGRSGFSARASAAHFVRTVRRFSARSAVASLSGAERGQTARTLFALE